VKQSLPFHDHNTRRPPPRLTLNGFGSLAALIAPLPAAHRREISHL
jgi:hypothetical protein